MMTVIVPLSFLPQKALMRVARQFRSLANSANKLFPFLQIELARADMNISAIEYLSLCLAATLFSSIFIFSLLALLLFPMNLYTLPIVVTITYLFMSLMLQLNYPKVSAHRRIRKLDADLLPALRAMTIQLHAGVPLFKALVIISNQAFGEVSKEFKKVADSINAGVSQLDALESLAIKNPSPYFRRVVWQMLNGLKEGAGIADVLSNLMDNLTKEQIIQIEKYGSQLNPIAMFYMMGGVIVPALGITITIIIASFMSIEENLIMLILAGFIVFVVLFQFFASGMIKTKRPGLLGE